jgi:hypothetical protein
MLKRKKHRKYKNPSDMDFHGPDRARTRRLMASESYDELPIRESIRKAVYRGPNGFGDSTSFGNPFSGHVHWKYLDNLLESYIGKEFAVYYQAMTMYFPRGFYRDNLDWFVNFRFHRVYRFGTPMWTYEIVDGKIVKV